MGAGPAGSSAARAAAKGGAKTIFIDKKEEVGDPVQCAESIGSYLIPHLPFKIPKQQLIWKIDGVYFSVNDITIERTGGIWPGYAINREKLDKWLAKKAVNTGAKLLLNTELIRLEVDGDYSVEKAFIRTQKGNKEIKPKVVIAADGVDSTVLKLLEFKVDLEKTGYVYSFEMSHIKIIKSNYDHIFIGDFAPGGYGYIFPLSSNTANVGVATLFKKDKIQEYFEDFLKIAKIENGIKIKEKSGIVPFLDQVKKWDYGNVLLTGDTANQNIKPFVEGFLPAIICGDIAGELAAKSLKREENLNKYANLVEKRIGPVLKQSAALSNVLYDLGKHTGKKYNLLRLKIASSESNYENTLNLSM